MSAKVVIRGLRSWSFASKPHTTWRLRSAADLKPHTRHDLISDLRDSARAGGAGSAGRMGLSDSLNDSGTASLGHAERFPRDGLYSMWTHSANGGLAESAQPTSLQ